jgi:hypothetical protein
MLNFIHLMLNSAFHFARPSSQALGTRLEGSRFRVCVVGTLVQVTLHWYLQLSYPLVQHRRMRAHVIELGTGTKSWQLSNMT